MVGYAFGSDGFNISKWNKSTASSQPGAGCGSWHARASSSSLSLVSEIEGWCKQIHLIEGNHNIKCLTCWHLWYDYDMSCETSVHIGPRPPECKCLWTNSALGACVDTPISFCTSVISKCIVLQIIPWPHSIPPRELGGHIVSMHFRGHR